MLNAELAFSDAAGGMNAFVPPNKIATNQVARAVNCGIQDMLLGTRPGVRVTVFDGVGSEVVAAGNVQGSVFFNPAKGQGGIIFADDNSMISVAAAGRKFVVKIRGRGGRSRGEVTEVAPGIFTDPQLHLAWISPWEDLLLFQDGNANCIIYDGANSTARESNGYNTVQKDRSEVPNAATVMAYAHGRGVVAVLSRFLLASDGLNELDKSTSGDLVKFVEQSYWATGKYFVPPSAMGGINALAILPQRNTQHGHGDLIAHCTDGIFSVDLNVFPRSAWASQPLVKHVLLDCGAVGPYALDIQDGDQLFRTRKGIQTLRSSAAESTLEGNPNQPISHEVNTWLKTDYPRWLRFASLSLWDTGRRFLCTTGPVVQGRFRWHRGMVVRNVDPKETENNTPPAWEGLWTLPPEIGGVIQFVRGIFDGEERVFAWCRGCDGRNRLVEFTTYLTADVLEDGSERAIRSQVITRLIDGGAFWKERENVSARLYLGNIVGDLKWGVWVRSLKAPAWVPFRSGKITFAPDASPVGVLTRGEPRTAMIPLGSLPTLCSPEGTGKLNEAAGVQFLVRWEGVCRFDGLRLKANDGDLAKDEVKCPGSTLTFTKVGVGDYDDFEYAETPTAPWFTDKTE